MNEEREIHSNIQLGDGMHMQEIDTGSLHYNVFRGLQVRWLITSRSTYWGSELANCLKLLVCYESAADWSFCAIRYQFLSWCFVIFSKNVILLSHFCDCWFYPVDRTPRKSGWFLKIYSWKSFRADGISSRTFKIFRRAPWLKWTLKCTSKLPSRI